MTKNLKIGLLLLFIFQLFIAQGFELAHDEAYYWLYSHHLDWGYFDHPPMVGIIIKIFSFFPHSELAVRVGFILLQFGTLFFLFDLIPKNRRSDAVLLFFAFPLASFSGLLALPDMPLLFLTGMYCWLLDKFLKKTDVTNSILLGICISLLLYSKYHGILLVFFTILAIPTLFKRKEFYIVAIVSIALFLPHVLWQYKHDFATLKYHFLERPKSDFSIGRSLEYLGLQVLLAGVFAGPLVWWFTLKRKSSSEFERSLLFMSVGIVVFFLISSFSKRVEANWTVLVAVPLIVFTLQNEQWEKIWGRRLLWSSFILVVGARILFVLPSSVPLPKRINEFRGWKDWTTFIDGKCDNPILANTYQYASKFSFYLNRPIHALNYHSRKNQFDFWPLDEGYYQTEEVCYLTDKRDFKGEEVVSPEGKKLQLIKNQNLKELFELKLSSH